QKGSMVNHKHLRFDFSHFSKMSLEEIKGVEQFVNEKIREQITLIEQRDLAYREAIDQGAIALFGEKYGDSVRTIKFGESMELCDGTPVQNPADILYFKIISEGADAAGIRRIESITGEVVQNYFAYQEDTLNLVKTDLTDAKDPVNAIVTLQEENNSL